MAKQTYEIKINYECESISILDRNIYRIARQIGYFSSGEYPPDHKGKRRFIFLFNTNRERQRFINAFRKFLNTSDFGIKVTVQEVD